MSPWLDVSIFGLTLFIMLVGLVGLIMPVFPGIIVIWLASLGYGIVNGFELVGAIVFAFITLIMIIGELVDNVLMGAGARQGGAAWLSIVLGLVGGVVGTLLLPPVGGLVLAPLTIFLIEFRRVKDAKLAWKATRGVALGWGVAYFVKISLGVLMIGLWLIWTFNH